ncbi:U3 small nucleolar RNA-associated protein 22 [Ceratobasidium sp. AG-Ba]|nr:U3 small nucleolar RNA-associated protein 22 [Ceratobasidium sp. AG-Ba]
MASITPKLFSPLKVGDIIIKHRVVMAPLTRYRANDDHVHTDIAVEYYKQRSSVPGTLLFTEGTYIADEATGYPKAPGIWNDAQIASWKRVTDAVHANGSFIFLQLWALGRAADPEVLKSKGYPLVSSSPTPISGGSVPKELSKDEIQRYIGLYAQAAKNAVFGAGFDGVEIHSANGYLPDQFLQDTCNKRTDEYGGSPENRARFVLEIVEAVTAAVGIKKTGVRFSPWSRYQDMRMDDPIPTFSCVVKELAKRHSDLAYIHFVEPVISGNIEVEYADEIGSARYPESNDFARDLWGDRTFLSAGGYNPESALKTADKFDNTAIVFGRYFIANSFPASSTARPKPEVEELEPEPDDEAMSDVEQDGDTSSEDDNATFVSHKAPGVFHAPTTQELLKLKQGSDLFKSNTFKLQLDELLREVSANDTQRSVIEGVLMTLHEHLTNLSAIPACKPPSTIKKRTCVPYPAPLPSEESQWTVSFERPSNIQLVGSWANGVAVKGNDGTGFLIDLAVEMPATLFREKDYLNSRYFHQRAYYLAVIASSLVSKGNSLGLGPEDVSYESLEYDIRRTLVVIAPTKDSTSELSQSKLKTPLSIRIIPTLSASNPISERHLAPGRASIRTTVSTDTAAEPTPTPLYNNLVHLSTTPLPNLLAIHSAKNQIPAYADTVALLKVWANQRGYGSRTGGGRCIRGCGGLGAWWGAVITYIVLGGKHVKSTKKQHKVGRGLSSYQLFRAVLDFFAKHDFTTTPIFLAESPYSLEDWKEHHDAIFIDSTGRYNMLAGVPAESLELLRLDAQASLALLDEASGEAFEAVFMHDIRHPFLRFDYSLRVPLDNPKFRMESLDKTIEWSSRTNSLLSALSSTLRKALGTRAKACVIVQPAPAHRPTLQSTPSSPSYVEIGVILDPVEAPRLVDYGPPADDPAGSEVFRAFWGAKSELRRFKDGRILESVVWDVSHPDERAHIPGRIIRHILQLHFGIKLEDVRQTVYDEVVRLPSSVVKIYSSVAENLMTFRPALAAFDAVVKQIKASEDLPLSLVTASPVSPSLRGTSVFFPWPVDLARYATLPDSVKYIPAMDVILQLEKSARWPDDLAAIQKIKLAFFVGIADALRAQDDKMRTEVVLDSDATETDIHDNASLEVLTPSGFAFRMRIYHDREKTLLDGIISDKKSTPKAVAHAKYALNLHELRFVHAPRHHAAAAALGHRFPSYAPAVRLTLRWAGVHLLLPHIPQELVELVVAREFLKPGIPPASAPTAFIRVLQTLKDWRWREEPLVVPIFSSLDDTLRGGKHLAGDAENTLKTLRREDPTMSRAAWVVVTEEDKSGVRWSGCSNLGPKAIIAARIQQLANASLAYVLSQEVVQKTLFIHPLSDYDFIIRLNPKMHPRYGENVAADSKIWTTPRGFVNKREDTKALICFDPAVEYLRDLQRAFGHVALFFHDPYGGELIAGLWDPKPTTQVTPFKAMLGYSSMPDKEGGKVRFNKKAVLREIELMGEGFIASIESKA